MTEQEVIDILMLEREPCYQRHDATEPDSCGHYNCQYHGICFYSELLYLFIGSHAEIEAHIAANQSTRTREEFCYGCGHRCQSVKYKGQHTKSWLGQGSMRHEEQCLCRGFAIEPGKWYPCHDEDAYKSQHDGLLTLRQGSQELPHESGLEGHQLRDLWPGADSEASERGLHRPEVS